MTHHFQAADPGHVDIDDHQMDRARVDHRNCFIAVASGPDVETKTTKCIGDRAAQRVIVVGYQQSGYHHGGHCTLDRHSGYNHKFSNCGANRLPYLAFCRRVAQFSMSNSIPPANRTKPAAPPASAGLPIPPLAPASAGDVAAVSDLAKRIIGNVERAIVGKRKQLVLSLVAWLSGGHILLEDVPGVAKTMLARALAKSVGCHFKRVQCTPDLLPSDVTGTSIFNQKTSEFEFRPGPVFTQILLADEINRATPRTQASLLEAMAEARVTVDGTTHVLPPPFLVIATQNPVDHEGTFPLPEAQLDRFLMRFTLGYPTMEEEMRMLTMLERVHPIDSLSSVAEASELVAAQEAIRGVRVDPRIRTYLLQLVHETRNHEDLALGGSPRATIALFRCAQAFAAIQGRTYVMPDDVKRIVAPVMNHRIIVRPESRLRKITAEKTVADILAEIAVPTIEPT